MGGSCLRCHENAAEGPNGLCRWCSYAPDPTPQRTENMTEAAINAAICHAVNYHGLDAKLNTADHELADLLAPEVAKHLAGQTDVQIIERMSPEERARIGMEGVDHEH